MKLLLIEDESELTHSIHRYLYDENVSCEMVSTFNQGLNQSLKNEYDCILLDIGLPDGNGLDLVAKLREDHPETGIIIISAKNSIDDKVKGLDLGADDYLTKPFHLSELNARIKSIMRRKSPEALQKIIFNEIKIFPESFKVFVHNAEIVLTRKEYYLLNYLLLNVNKVVSRESISTHLWGRAMNLSEAYQLIYTHIKNIRKKLLKNGSQDYIQTVHGIGYRFGES